jgi:hypothetical protein
VHPHCISSHFSLLMRLDTLRELFPEAALCLPQPLSHAMFFSLRLAPIEDLSTMPVTAGL